MSKTGRPRGRPTKAEAEAWAAANAAGGAGAGPAAGAGSSAGWVRSAADLLRGEDAVAPAVVDEEELIRVAEAEAAEQEADEGDAEADGGGEEDSAAVRPPPGQGAPSFMQRKGGRAPGRPRPAPGPPADDAVAKHLQRIAEAKAKRNKPQGFMDRGPRDRFESKSNQMNLHMAQKW